MRREKSCQISRFLANLAIFYDNENERLNKNLAKRSNFNYTYS